MAWQQWDVKKQRTVVKLAIEYSKNTPKEKLNGRDNLLYVLKKLAERGIKENIRDIKSFLQQFNGQNNPNKNDGTKNKDSDSNCESDCSRTKQDSAEIRATKLDNSSNSDTSETVKSSLLDASKTNSTTSNSSSSVNSSITHKSGTFENNSTSESISNTPNGDTPINNITASDTCKSHCDQPLNKKIKTGAVDEACSEGINIKIKQPNNAQSPNKKLSMTAKDFITPQGGRDEMDIDKAPNRCLKSDGAANKKITCKSQSNSIAVSDFSADPITRKDHNERMKNSLKTMMETVVHHNPEETMMETVVHHNGEETMMETVVHHNPTLVEKPLINCKDTKPSDVTKQQLDLDSSITHTQSEVHEPEPEGKSSSTSSTGVAVNKETTLVENFDSNKNEIIYPVSSEEKTQSDIHKHIQIRAPKKSLILTSKNRCATPGSTKSEQFDINNTKTDIHFSKDQNSDHIRTTRQSSESSENEVVTVTGTTTSDSISGTSKTRVPPKVQKPLKRRTTRQSSGASENEAAVAIATSNNSISDSSKNHIPLDVQKHVKTRTTRRSSVPSENEAVAVAIATSNNSISDSSKNPISLDVQKHVKTRTTRQSSVASENEAAAVAVATTDNSTSDSSKNHVLLKLQKPLKTRTTRQSLISSENKAATVTGTTTNETTSGSSKPHVQPEDQKPGQSPIKQPSNSISNEAVAKMTAITTEDQKLDQEQKHQVKTVRPIRKTYLKIRKKKQRQKKDEMEEQPAPPSSQLDADSATSSAEHGPEAAEAPRYSGSNPNPYTKVYLHRKHRYMRDYYASENVDEGRLNVSPITDDPCPVPFKRIKLQPRSTPQSPPMCSITEVQSILGEETPSLTENHPNTSKIPVVQEGSKIPTDITRPFQDYGTFCDPSPPLSPSMVFPETPRSVRPAPESPRGDRNMELNGVVVDKVVEKDCCQAIKRVEKFMKMQRIMLQNLKDSFAAQAKETENRIRRMQVLQKKEFMKMQSMLQKLENSFTAQRKEMEDLLEECKCCKRKDL